MIKNLSYHTVSVALAIHGPGPDEKTDAISGTRIRRCLRRRQAKCCANRRERSAKDGRGADEAIVTHLSFLSLKRGSPSPPTVGGEGA